MSKAQNKEMSTILHSFQGMPSEMKIRDLKTSAFLNTEAICPIGRENVRKD